MIKSTKPLLYHARDGQKFGIIEVAINSWTTTKAGIIFTVTDYDISNGVRVFVDEKEVPRSWDQLNSLNDYLESINSYSGLTKMEMEFLKVKHGLLLDTQTKPIYCSEASDWVLTGNEDI